MQEIIERKESYVKQGKKIEEFYEDENKRSDTKIVYSELKNLPSPIFKVFAKSDKEWIVELIKTKNVRESALKVVEESFTRGRSLKLVKRNAQLADFEEESPDDQAKNRK